MIGDYKFKYIAFAIIILVFFVFSYQNSFAQTKIFSPPAPMEAALQPGPPGQEELNSFWNNAARTTKSIFQNIKKIGDNLSSLSPFFQNIFEKVGTWWSIRARSWILIQWNCFNNYLEQEIKIE